MAVGKPSSGGKGGPESSAASVVGPIGGFEGVGSALNGVGVAMTTTPDEGAASAANVLTLAESAITASWTIIDNFGETPLFNEQKLHVRRDQVQETTER